MATTVDRGKDTGMDGFLAEVFGAGIVVVAIRIADAATCNRRMRTQVVCHITRISGTGGVIIAVSRRGADAKLRIWSMLAFVVHAGVDGIIGAVLAIQID